MHWNNTPSVFERERMGGCMSRGQRQHTSTAETPVAPVALSETSAEATKSPVTELRSSAAGGDDDGGANPDLVGVTLQCSCNLGCIYDQHLQKLLKDLYNGMQTFQWTLSARFSDSSDVAPGYKCFCSTYPMQASRARWPWGVSDVTNTVLVDLWIQSTSTNKNKPHDVKDYISNKIGEWVGDTLKCSDKVWVMCRYSSPSGSGALEKVAGKGYQNGKLVSEQ